MLSDICILLWHSAPLTGKVKNYLQMRGKKIIFLTLFLLTSFAGMSQRVGLVLSGGGAKGLYHIGVIRALEENGIPIDYVSGTSMGSIIGGMYATGLSPAEMEKIVTSNRVKTWMTGKIDPKYSYYFKRMRQNAAMITIRGDFKKSKPFAQFPSNLISSGPLDMSFLEYFSPAQAASKGNFDSLMVPFRCVATDATDHKEVVFSSGNLGQAIRASMAIPLVFKPVKKDSMLLYDGGLYNNFPWQPIEEDFNPDILIGSKCADSNSNPDENSLMDQIFSITMLHTDYTLPQGKGIMIERVFDDVSTMDFAKAAYVIAKGYEDAMAMMPAILERISRRVDPAEMAQKREEYKNSLPPLMIDQVNISGLNSKQRQYVINTMRLNHKKKDIYTFPEVEREYFKLLSEGEIESDYPGVEYNQATGYFDLNLHMRAKPSFKIMVGGNISSTSLTQAYIGLEYKRIGLNAHNYNFDGYLSMLYSSAFLGGRSDIFLKIPFFVDYGLQYNYYNYFRSNDGFLSKGNDLAYSKALDVYATAAVGLALGRNSVLSLRANLGREQYRYFQEKGHEDSDTLDKTRFDFVGVQLEVERNSLNYPLFPIRGTYQKASLIFIDGRESFYPGSHPDPSQFQKEGPTERYWFGAMFTRQEYFRVAKWFSFGYDITGVLTNHPSFYNEYATNISSPTFAPTLHSKSIYMKEFRSKAYVAAGLLPTFEFMDKFYLQSAAYAYLPENLDGTKEGIKQRLRYIFSSSLVYQTIVGPISLTLSKYDTKQNNWFITFNFGFAIFNKKGLFY